MQATAVWTMLAPYLTDGRRMGDSGGKERREEGGERRVERGEWREERGERRVERGVEL